MITFFKINHIPKTLFLFYLINYYLYKINSFKEILYLFYKTFLN
jgi:hypothetical protein